MRSLWVLLALTFLGSHSSCMIKQFSALEKSSPADKFSHCIAVRCHDGVVLGAVETSPLTDMRRLSSPRKCFFNLGSGMVCAGVTADIEFIARVAREVAQSYREDFREGITGAILADKLSSFLYDYNAQESVRPLGIALIIVSEDGDLYMLRSNSELRAYRACVTLTPPPKEMLAFLQSERWTDLSCEDVENRIKTYYSRSSEFGSDITVRLQRVRTDTKVDPPSQGMN